MNKALITRFVIAVLASYRLAFMLAFEDGPLSVFATLRGLTVYDRKGNARSGVVWESLTELFLCPYCLGVWCSALMTLLVTPLSAFSFVLWLGIAGGQSALHYILHDLKKG